MVLGLDEHYVTAHEAIGLRPGKTNPIVHILVKTIRKK